LIHAAATEADEISNLQAEVGHFAVVRNMQK
jgi:hypothetical protein